MIEQKLIQILQTDDIQIEEVSQILFEFHKNHIVCSQNLFENLFNKLKKEIDQKYKILKENSYKINEADNMDSLQCLLDFESCYNGLMALDFIKNTNSQEYLYKLGKFFIASH